MKKTLALCILTITIFPHCGKQSEKTASSQEKNYELFTKGNIPKGTMTKIATKKVNEPDMDNKNHISELDFEVENNTGKTVFITCFSYIQKEPGVRWRWDKSPVYKLDQGESVFINIDSIPDKTNRNDTFGYLAVFEKENEAQESIYELLEDTQKIDLDRLNKLEKKKITLSIEKYGFKKEIIDFAVEEKVKKKYKTPELDFIVENKTGKTIFITSFIYLIKDDIRTVWHYDKTPVQRLEPNQISIIDVDTVAQERDRGYMLGYLAVFEADKEQEAHNSTYELLSPSNKISLGNIALLKGKKVSIGIEQYGTIGQIAEFDIQPAKPPQFEKSYTQTAKPTTIEKTNGKNSINKSPTIQNTNKTYRLFS